MRICRVFNTNNIWVSLNAFKEKPYEITSEIIVNKKVGGDRIVTRY